MKKGPDARFIGLRQYGQDSLISTARTKHSLHLSHHLASHQFQRQEHSPDMPALCSRQFERRITTDHAHDPSVHAADQSQPTSFLDSESLLSLFDGQKAVVRAKGGSDNKRGAF